MKLFKRYTHKTKPWQKATITGVIKDTGKYLVSVYLGRNKQGEPIINNTVLRPEYFEANYKV